MLKKKGTLLSILWLPPSPCQLSAHVWPLSRAPVMLVPIPGLRGRVELLVLISLAFEISGSDFLPLAASDCELHFPDPLSLLLCKGIITDENPWQRMVLP